MSDADILRSNEHAIADAHINLDLGALDRLYHPDFVIAQPDGSTETKAEVLGSFANGERHWCVAAVDELRVTIVGGTGIVLGRWRATGRNRGVEFDYAARFLSVWTHDSEGWRNLAYQSAEIPVIPPSEGA